MKKVNFLYGGLKLVKVNIVLLTKVGPPADNQAITVPGKRKDKL